MGEEMRRSFRGLPRLHPLTDVIEREDGLHIFMDMPGVAKEDLRVELDSSELTVSARSSHPWKADEKFLEIEFGGCEYRRQFKLSQEIDRNRVKAVLKNGVLEVFLPNSKSSSPSRIEITGP
jgi:HSP20 family molecular chaperone IbpA